MHDNRKDETERVSRVVVVGLSAIGVALLAAGVVGIYDASVERGHAVGEVVRSSTERQPDVTEYLPGSSLQLGSLSEPLMLARRAALRAGFDRDDAPIDAFDRLRSVPGHDEEARSLLAQFWERRAMLADDPVRRVLYALQARVVDDDDVRRGTAASALAAFGPLRKARHVAEGTVLWSDARLLVVRGSGWVHVVDEETQISFDLPESDAISALIDGHRMLTWGGDAARVWNIDPVAPAPTAPAASLKLLAGEVPLSLSGDCVLTSAARVWRVGASTDVVTAVHKHWTGGNVDPACDRVVLWGDAIASYRRRGATWTIDSTKSPGFKGFRGLPAGRSRDLPIEACASEAPRCAIRDFADPASPENSPSVASIWDLGASPPRRLFDDVACEVARLSPDGTRVICRDSQNGVTLYGEDEAGVWTRTDTLLPPVAGVFLEDDGTICGTLRRRGASPSDRSDVFFFDSHECWAPAAIERAWSSIRMTPSGRGAVFTFPPTVRAPSGNTEYLGFDSNGESLAAASNAWFGDGKDERLLEHDATNSAGEKSYELAGLPFDPGAAFEPRLGPIKRGVSSIQIDHAVFVEAPQPSLVFEMSYRKGSAAGASLLHAVARWDLHEQRFCGPVVAGALDGVAPGGDAVVIDGHIEKVGACTPERGFDPTDVTDAVAVGPGSARWLSRDGDWLQLHGAPTHPAAVPIPESRADRRSASGEASRERRDGRDPQIVFGPDGDRFFVKTADGLCVWMVRDDGTPDLDGCRWSTAGWASDAAWAVDDKTGVRVIVFDRTAEGAAPRVFFGSRENANAKEPDGDLACNAPMRAREAPLAALQQWEERLGHRFKDQAAPMQDTVEITSTEIVPTDAPPH